MKSIYKGLLAIGFASLITSCDFTDLDPTDKVSEGDIFSSVSALDQTVTGIYAKMEFKETIRSSSVLSDDVIKGGQNGGASDDTYQWTYTASTGDHNELWRKYNYVVAMTNRVLRGAPEVEGATEEDRKIIDNSIGTAKFLRAYNSFDLLRFFSDFEDGSNYGIPYVKQVIILETPGRNTVTECFNFIYEDLEDAKSLLSQDKSDDPAYASKTAVDALYARAYLYQRQYDKAYEYAKSVLQDKPLATMDEYAEIWSDESNADVILKLPRFAGEETIGTIYYSANNSSAFEPSAELINSFAENNIRLDLFVGDGVDREDVPVKRVIKYKGTPENVGLADAKLFRSSEMILIMAEAKMQQNDLTEANSLLNQLRRERIVGWVDTNYTTKEDFIEQLLLERRRELCYEGHRFFDLRRYNLPVYKALIDKTLDVNNYRRIYPIPYSEMQGNPVIAGQQNPGY